MREVISRILWQALIRRLARAHGFPDPAALLTQISRFAQPADVLVPTEILRLGLLLQARGLLNGQAFQHNLDWIWPYWVERQFDPTSPSFVPRAFSVTHINLTHRNWTALGLPGCAHLPIVDPRGLVTPFFDGWSIDGWVVAHDGEALVPSRADTCTQSIEELAGLALTSNTRAGDLGLAVTADVTLSGGIPTCRIRLAGMASRAAWLVVALRPCNPEGVSLVHDISLAGRQEGWRVNNQRTVRWDAQPERCLFSCYREADVFHRIRDGSAEDTRTEINCPVGMATGAALFRIAPHAKTEVQVEIPLEPAGHSGIRSRAEDPRSLWSRALDPAATLRIPDRRVELLFQAALRTLILHTPGDVYAGPYTYKRFWFRDAVQIAHALMCVGLISRARAVLDTFGGRQNRSGYFHSQEGEWDSNGQVLWAYGRFCELSGAPPDSRWIEPARRAAEWIRRKRVRGNPDLPHDGLMPAGFSAEHLGTNDFYYWDDFWSIAGLRAASEMMTAVARPADAARFREEADGLLRSIHRSLEPVRQRLEGDGIPASPYRRMDSGAVGSLAAGYPLQIWTADDARLRATAMYLVDRHLLKDALFHDIAHSGLNPYLTLHLAEVLLRTGDDRFRRLMRGVAALASPTGQWPEAVHPRLGTGCMGDGEHAWAAAEWLMMVRNCFVREESAPPRLILCSGVWPEWLDADAIGFGPTPTRFGDVSVTVRKDRGDVLVEWRADWRVAPSHVEVTLPGFERALIDSHATTARLAPVLQGA